MDINHKSYRSELEISAESHRSELTISAEVYRVGEEKKMTLRLPPLLHAALAKIARDDRRSLHAQIITLLEDAARRRGEYSGEVESKAQP